MAATRNALTRFGWRSLFAGCRSRAAAVRTALRWLRARMPAASPPSVSGWTRISKLGPRLHSAA
eukprot:5357501-Prymnesium_polylepis.1